MRLAKWMYWNTSRCEWNYSFPSWLKLTARLQVNMSWLVLLLYLFLSLPQTIAVRWDGVQPTQVHLRGLQGHEPTTTPRPTVRPALFKRGGIVSGTANLDDGVCGTDIIASEASFVCESWEQPSNIFFTGQRSNVINCGSMAGLHLGWLVRLQHACSEQSLLCKYRYCRIVDLLGRLRCPTYRMCPCRQYLSM